MKKLLFLLLFLFLTGCFNYKELSNLAIVEGASIDLINDEYIVTYATINSSGENKNVLIEGKGKTISDAISYMNLKSSEEFYIGHMLTFIISENAAKNGVNKVIDYFFRNPKHKKTFQFFISKNNEAREILKKLTEANDSKFLSISNNLEENSLSEFTFNTTLMSFLKNIKDPGIEPIINGIKIDNDKLKIEPLAIFKDDKLIKWEDANMSKYINLLINQSSTFKINSNCGDKNISYSINNVSVKKNYKFDNTVNFKINITGNTEINEMSCHYDLNNPDDLKLIEKNLVSTLKDNLNKTIDEVKKTKIDFLGLGYYIYQNDYTSYMKIKNNYIENLNVSFDIEPNIHANENPSEGTYDLNE